MRCRLGKGTGGSAEQRDGRQREHQRGGGQEADSRFWECNATNYAPPPLCSPY